MEHRLGIDLGGTFIKAGIVDADNRIISRVSKPTDGSFVRTCRDMADAAKEAAHKAGLDITDFPCAGVGSPSCINRKTGRLVYANNTDWRDAPLKEELEKYIPLPVYIGNDANCAVIGEAVAGAAREYEDVLMLTLGTGVGGGVLINGKLYSGSDGMGTELGHTPLVHGGVPCTCGMSGCLEAYASVTGLIRMTKGSMIANPYSMMHAFAAKEGGEISGKTSFDCAKAGDAAAIMVVDDYCEYVACGIGGFINIFRPQVVLIGGGLSNAGDFLLDRLRKKSEKYVFAYNLIGGPAIVQAMLGNDAGIIGAAWLDRMQM
jgi:glucokinase